MAGNHAPQQIRTMRSGYHPSLEKRENNCSLKKQGFYHTPAWRRARKLALQRDHFLCQECLRKKKMVPATEVHHVLPLEDFPELGLELSNLTSLCWYCHEDTKHKKQEQTVSGIRILKIGDGSEMEEWSRNAGSQSAAESGSADGNAAGAGSEAADPIPPYPRS